MSWLRLASCACLRASSSALRSLSVSVVRSLNDCPSTPTRAPNGPNVLAPATTAEPYSPSLDVVSPSFCPKILASGAIVLMIVPARLDTPDPIVYIVAAFPSLPTIEPILDTTGWSVAFTVLPRPTFFTFSPNVRPFQFENCPAELRNIFSCPFI